MNYWFINYFTNGDTVSLPRRILLITLSVLLFFVLIVYGSILTLQRSLFNPDYFASYIDDVNVTQIASDWLTENVAPEDPVIAKAAELGIAQFEPQIRDLLRILVRNLHTFYLNGLEEGRLLETIAEQRPMVNDVITNLDPVLDLPVLESVLEALAINPKSITDSINVDQINAFFDEVERVAQQQRLVAWVKNLFVPMTIFLLALIIGIVLTARKARLVISALGIPFLTYGILQFFSAIAIHAYRSSLVEQLNINPVATDYVLRFFSDTTGILMIYSAVFLFLGSLLMTMHFLLKNWQKATIQEDNLTSLPG